MGLRFLSSRRMASARSLTHPQTVIDSNSLREAALRASWHRDHRVARRRQAWRWALFWGWKYGCKSGFLIVPVAVAGYLVFQPWAHDWLPQANTASVLGPSPTPNTVSATPDAGLIPTPHSDAAQGIRLVPAPALQASAVNSASTGEDPPDNASSPPSFQPLRLTPEIQTSPKESSP